MIGIIVAMTRDHIIGVNGTIPWNHKGDQARFKRITMHSTVIMGRKTWESIPENRRPLEGRENVVLSSRQIIFPEHIPRTPYVANGPLEVVIRNFHRNEDVWIIGGASVYADAMPFVSLIDVTYVPDVGWKRIPDEKRFLLGKCEGETRCLACDRIGSHLEEAEWAMFPTIDEERFVGGEEEVHPENPELRIRRFVRRVK